MKLNFLKIFGLFCLFVVFFIVFLFWFYGKELPRPENFTDVEISQSTKIYDRTGKILLYEIYKTEKREYVKIKDIPKNLIFAVIVAEDRSFFRHHGVKIRSIIRAILYDLKLKSPYYGASTITQQLIRNTFLTNKKTIKRKTEEIILALELEMKYPKNQILEWYLNQIPFAGNNYGVQAAARSYFNKNVKDLTLSESVILAAVIKSPEYFSPWSKKFEDRKNQLKERKNYILSEMKKLGYISESDFEKAIKENVTFAKAKNLIIAPHFSLYVKKLLTKMYGKDYLAKKGLKVYTTLDYNFQKEAEKIVKKISERNKKYAAYNAALVVINPKNGQVLSLIGSKDWFAQPEPVNCQPGVNCKFDPKVNVAFQTRQPGSAFKPLVYYKALEKGFTPKTILWDVKTEFNPNCNPDCSQERDAFSQKCYHPKNYDNKFRGPVTLRDSLAQSINITSVKLLYLVGIKDVLNLAKNLGISTLNEQGNYGLSLVLGGGGVKLLELTSAYGVFATEGIRYKPSFILKIEDSEGNIIYQNNQKGEKVLDQNICRQLNDILLDNKARAPMFGWYSNLYFENYQVAAKTGTSEDFRDAWTIGYTPNIVVGVWVGNSDYSKMQRRSGVALAAPIFHDFLENILKSLPKENFEKPIYTKTNKPILDGYYNIKNPHSILYYIDRNDILGPLPKNPEKDPLFYNFEQGILNWINSFSKKN